MARGGLKGIEFGGEGVGFTPSGLLALLDQLPVALAVTRGPDHVYVYANKLYRSIHEPSTGKLSGRPFASIFGSLLGDEYLRLRNRILAKNITYTVRDVHIQHNKRDTYWDIMLVPVLSKKKKPEGVMSIAVEVTHRVQAQETAAQFTRELQSRTKEIAKERERLTIAVEATGIGIWEWVVESDHLYWSARTKEIFGLDSDDDPSYAHWQSSLHPEERDAVLAQVGARLDPASSGELKMHHRIVTPNGDTKWIASAARMLYAETDAGRIPARLLGTILDVTDRHNAEEELREAIAIKDMLSRETHHRVKNSLQIVSAMLSLQERVANAPELKAALTDAASRIRTVAALHEQLHQAQSTTAVELSAYLATLCKDLERTVEGTALSVEFEGEPVWVPNERAISVALIVNELTTNALKYAYPDGTGVVRVSFRKIHEDRLVLVVEDDGVGLGQDFEKKQHESLGMLMAQTMARQLGGEIVTAKVRRGARFELVVSIAEHNG